jgi:hypothetical protein
VVPREAASLPVDLRAKNQKPKTNGGTGRSLCGSFRGFVVGIEYSLRFLLSTRGSETISWTGVA